jgi:hypothetical protein
MIVMSYFYQMPSVLAVPNSPPKIPVFSRCRASPPYAFSLYAFLGFVKGVFMGKKAFKFFRKSYSVFSGKNFGIVQREL